MLWDVNSRKLDPVQVLKDAKDSITSIQITDHEILTTSVDCCVRVYDIRMGKMIKDYIGSIITFGNITHDGQCYVLSCSDDMVKLFDKDLGELLNKFTGHVCKDYLIESAINAKDSHILSGSATGEIYFWDLITAECTQKLIHSRTKPVVTLSHHPTGNFVLSACESEIKLWGEKIGDDSEISHE